MCIRDRRSTAETYLSSCCDPTQRHLEQERLALPAATYSHVVAGREADTCLHAGWQRPCAGATLLPWQLRRHRRVLAHEPRPELLPRRRLPGAHADRHPRPAYSPREV